MSAPLAKIQRCEHMIPFLREALELDPQRDMRTVVCLEPGAQAPLQVWLVEGDKLRMAIQAAQRIHPAEQAQHGRPHVDVRYGDRLEIALRNAGKLKDAQRLVIERDRTGRHKYF